MSELKPFSSQAQSLNPGDFYEHYKKKRYKIIGVARHTESLEEVVVYHCLGETDLWVRPVEMFLEEIEIAGEKTPRFKKVS